MTRALTRGGLAWRGFCHYRRSHLAVLLATATVTAIITGALVVGDSVRASLAGRILERLGRVDYALVGSRFFRAELADELKKAVGSSSLAERVEPVILLEGTVVHEITRQRVAHVNVVGVSEHFWKLSRDELRLPVDAAQWATGTDATGPSLLVNEALRSAIGADDGDTLLVYFAAGGDVPAEHALGSKEDGIRPLRAGLAGTLADRGLGIFDLGLGQKTARNVFVPLPTLQRAVEREGRANALLVASGAERAFGGDEEARVLDQALKHAWILDDLGLTLTEVPRPERATASYPAGSYVALESRELLLRDSVVEAAQRAAAALDASAAEVLTYLANTIRVGDRAIPYSTVTATQTLDGISPFEDLEPGWFERTGGIVLGAWAASDLGARPGDVVTLEYFVAGADQQLEVARADLRLDGIVALGDAAADPSWTPTYPGISDKASLRDWDPPFPVELDRIRDADEEYWDDYRATPKAFVSLAQGRALWSSRFGSTTSVRVRSATRPPDEAPQGGAQLATRFRARLLEELRPAELGLTFRAVKAAGIRAARSGTDFTGLFVGFSFFLIVSALVLLSLLYRLGCEARAREFGILSATGFPLAVVRGLFVREASFSVVVGTLLGTAGAVGYAGLLIFGLRGQWREAVNAPFLSLHVQFGTLAVGCALTTVLALGTLFATVRRLSRVSASRLLRGVSDAPSPSRSGRAGASRASRFATLGALVAAGGLLFLGITTELLPAAAAFFGAGACLLVFGLLLLRSLFATRPPGIAGRGRVDGLACLGVRNWSRKPGRSLLTVTLLACAVFIIVAVAASRRDATGLEPERESGNGGFALVGTAANPLLQPLWTLDGREELALSSETSALVEQAKPQGLRLRPGDDASCLNLYRPAEPRVLGAPPDFVARGGFSWAGTLAETEAERRNPWLLLERRFEDGAVAAIGDAAAVKWILHSGLGQDLIVTGDGGQPVRLRLVGLLAHSIFQGELLIAEEHFVEAFPTRMGRSFFLFEPPEGGVGTLVADLERELGDYGMDVETTAARLASYQAVENTYLSTFQVLGGLGLLLGTLGLGVVLYRNILERRGELALLRAVGFPRGSLGWMVLSETAFLLTLGLLIGAGAALVGVLPNREAAAQLPWAPLASTLLTILIVGLLASAVSVRAALGAPLLPALREE